jgi:hypothetical protein
MPSMTPMISLIFLLEAWISSILRRLRSRLRRPVGDLGGAAASWSASRAFSAFWPTVEVSSSMEAAVSSMLEACSSVRDDRSALPEAICEEAVVTASAPSRTWETRIGERFVHAAKRVHEAARSRHETSHRRSW